MVEGLLQIYYGYDILGIFLGLDLGLKRLRAESNHLKSWEEYESLDQSVN